MDSIALTHALHTSQSSISAQIRDLEQEIGVTLFKTAFLDFIRSKKKLIRSSRKVEPV
ncbi:MAG TPA: LysR family transcriptional regulator [Acidobacteriaceae bacterium]|jgi:hypothetical protein